MAQKKKKGGGAKKKKGGGGREKKTYPDYDSRHAACVRGIYEYRGQHSEVVASKICSKSLAKKGTGHDRTTKEGRAYARKRAKETKAKKKKLSRVDLSDNYGGAFSSPGGFGGF